MSAQVIDLASGAKSVPEREFFTDKGGLIPGVLGDLIRQEMPVAYGPDGRFYVYRGGVYRPDDEERMIRARTRALIGEDRIRAHHYGEVIADMKATARAIPDDPDPEVLNVANGLLNWRTGELRPHTPQHLSVTQVPWPYDPNAPEPEQILAFLRSVVDTDEDVELLIETAGYALYPGNPFKLAIMVHSPHPDSGKGTYLRLLTALLGANNVAAHTLHSLSENRFAAADLLYKFANVNGDLDARSINDTSLFKQITGQDLIPAERKGRPFFTFRCTALPVFAANERPGAADKTAAWYSRWRMIDFPHRFPRDPHFEATLHTPEGMTGFLGLAVEALQRVIQRGSFRETEATKAAGREYRLGSDFVARYVEPRITGCAADTVSGKALRSAFNAWLAENEPKASAMGSRAFYTRVRALQGVEQVGVDRLDSPVFSGIKATEADLREARYAEEGP